MSMLLFCVLGAVLFVVIYLLGRQARRLGAWLMQQEGPRERRNAFIMIAAIIGAIAGGMAHHPVQAVMACKAAGHSTAACVLERGRGPACTRSGLTAARFKPTASTGCG